MNSNQLETDATHFSNEPQIAHLPTELLTLVLTYLDLRSAVSRVPRVCRTWLELLTEQDDVWIGLIIETLRLSDVRDAGLAAVACGENEPGMEIGTLYFLLRHCFDQLQHGTRASSVTTWTRRNNPRVVFPSFEPLPNLYEAVQMCTGASIAAVQRHAGGAGLCLGEMVPYGDGSQVAVVLGSFVDSEWPPILSRVEGLLGLTVADEALVNLNLAISKAKAGAFPYLRPRFRHSFSWSTTGQIPGWQLVGVPVFPGGSWRSADPAVRSRVLLGLLFMVIDSQGFIGYEERVIYEPLGEYTSSPGPCVEAVVYPLEFVLGVVLDTIVLRALVQFQHV